MMYEGPPYHVGDVVGWLCWKLSGFPLPRRGYVRRIVEPARSAHGPRLAIRATDGLGDTELLPGLHGVFKVSAVDALAELAR